MPLTLQPKLLRVLENGAFTPIGATEERRTDVRIVAATNANLQAKIADGRFREDLYFRLARFTVELPPLRERKEDIPLLADHFLKMFSEEMSSPTYTSSRSPALSPEAMDALMNYSFPGNVRELKNMIEGALILSRGGIIQSEHLHFVQFVPTNPPTHLSSPIHADSTPDPGGVQRFLDECCEFHPDGEVHKPKLLQRYKQFCRTEEYTALSRNRFYKRMLELCPEVLPTQISDKRLAGFKGLMIRK